MRSKVKTLFSPSAALHKEFFFYLGQFDMEMLLLCVLLQEAKEKFQQLQKVMSILGDEEKKAVYDQTGSIDDAVSPCFFSFVIAVSEIKLLRFPF